MIEPARDIQPDTRPGTARKPLLLFFYSQTSGHCRRVEGFLAQVLQRGRNHSAFALRRIDHDLRPDLFVKFGVEEPPALIVVDAKRVRARLEKPRGCVEIQTALAPWLRSA
jgi:thioredoxin-like negative regulator of GroEL